MTSTEQRVSPHVHGAKSSTQAAIDACLLYVMFFPTISNDATEINIAMSHGATANTGAVPGVDLFSSPILLI